MSDAGGAVGRAAAAAGALLVAAGAVLLGEAALRFAVDLRVGVSGGGAAAVWVGFYRVVTAAFGGAAVVAGAMAMRGAPGARAVGMPAAMGMLPCAAIETVRMLVADVALIAGWLDSYYPSDHTRAVVVIAALVGTQALHLAVPLAIVVAFRREA